MRELLSPSVDSSQVTTLDADYRQMHADRSFTDGDSGAMVSQPEARNEADRADGASIGDSGWLSIRVGTALADVERQMIMATLRSCAGNKTRAAAVLGVSLKTLYNRLNEYRASSSEGGNTFPMNCAR